VVRSVLLYVVLPIALGVVSADVWRLDVPLLTAVLSAQAPWAVLPFLVCLRVRTPARGALLGAAFGLLAMAGYFGWEWVAYTAHAALAQLEDGRGVFWFAGAAAAGGVFGLLGSLSGHPPSRGPRWLPGFGWAAACTVLLAEAAYQLGRLPFIDGRAVVASAALVLVALAVAVAVTGARRSGPRPFAVAFALALVTASAGFMLMLWAEHTFAYVPL
jgi:hypothetical protein